MANIHEITLQQAIDMTRLYRTNRPSNFPVCETFDITAVIKLISVEGCKYLRIYYGMKEDLTVDAILVAVGAEGDDLLPAFGNNNILLEDGYRCPPDCPPASSLNG
jgi:hypothetical protein